MKNKKMIGFLIIFFVLGTISPFLAFIVILCFVLINAKIKKGDEQVKKQQGLDSSIKMHKDNTYAVNKKSDYHGVSKENRDRSYTTRELYEDIANRKTDYRGVNKDLL